MIPPQLRNHWLHRVMFDPRAPKPHVESFFVKANDPKKNRALWVRLTLLSDGKEHFGEAWAIVFDRDQGRYIAAKEKWPFSRVLIDPERPGIGIGPCAVEEGRSYGVVRGAEHTVSWELDLNDELPPYRHLPSEQLYKTPLVSFKMVSPHPSATLTGRCEIWENKSRHAEREVWKLDGWRGMQGHNWGKRHSSDYAWAHCNAFKEVGEAAFFEGFVGRAKVAGMMTPPVSMARLRVGDKEYRFDTWRNFSGGKGEKQALRWRFELSGPDGRLHGELHTPPDEAVGLTYYNPKEPPVHIVNSKLARLELKLTPKEGPTMVLTSDRAALETAQLSPVSGVKVLL